MKILSLLLLTSCTSLMPLKHFKSIQYLPDNNSCFERSLGNNTVERKCYIDGVSHDWVVIKKSDFNKELGYQDLLINRCWKWTK